MNALHMPAWPGTRVAVSLGMTAMIGAMGIPAVAAAAAPAYADFAVFSVGTGATVLDMGSNAKVSGGFIGGNGAITVGSNAQLAGVRALGAIKLGSNAKAGGVELLAAPVMLPAPRDFAASATSAGDRTLGSNGTLVLAPGTYRNITLGSNGKLTLSAGTYVINNLTMGSNAAITVNAGAGSVTLLAAGNVSLGSNAKIIVSQGSPEDFYLEAKGGITLGSNAQVQGTFHSTKSGVSGQASVELGSNAKVTGALYARGLIKLGSNPQITARPADFELPPAPVPGCTDPEALNYDEDATQEDGSCQYPPPPDTQAPLIEPKEDVTVQAEDENGAVVTYATPLATDNKDDSVPVSCEPPSGSQFSIGTTTVSCTAQDAAGNQATSSFNVIVEPLPPSGPQPGDLFIMASQPNDSFLCAFPPGWRSCFTGGANAVTLDMGEGKDGFIKSVTIAMGEPLPVNPNNFWSITIQCFADGAYAIPCAEWTSIVAVANDMASSDTPGKHYATAHFTGDRTFAAGSYYRLVVNGSGFHTGAWGSGNPGQLYWVLTGEKF